MRTSLPPPGTHPAEAQGADGPVPSQGPATFRAIVPAGGAGTRLWPLSRRAHPKFLHDLTRAGRSLLQATYDRLEPLSSEVVVVTGQGHVARVREQLPALADEAIFEEPAPRDSMAAIALAAEVLRRRHPQEDLVVGSFAADHVIADEEAFGHAVRAAIAAARDDHLVALGIGPDRPSTAFGYIRPGDPRDGYRLVDEFVEKPSDDVAAGYVADGYLWNAGMYLIRAVRLAEHLARFQPELAAGIARIADAWDTPADRERVLAEVWPGLPAISIDHAISEPLAALGGVAVVPADLGWNDIGGWDAIADVLPATASNRSVTSTSSAASAGPPVSAGSATASGPAPRDGKLNGVADGSEPATPTSTVTVLGDAGAAGRVHAYDSDGCLVVPGDSTVVVLGLPDAVVVNTGDVILVTTREQSRHLKRVVDDLASGDARSLL